MKELVKANIIKQEKGVTEEDLLELIYDDNSKKYVSPYNIDKLEKTYYNWNALKMWLEDNWKQSKDIWYVKIINKMQELESNNEEDNSI